MTTVLICDDHRIVREGLRQFVAGDPGSTLLLLPIPEDHP